MTNSKKKYMKQYKLSPMTLEEKIRILKDFLIFQDAPEKEITSFAEKMTPTLIHPMEVFVEQDTDEHEAFFIYQGAASIFRMNNEGEYINIDLLGAPELVGEMGLVDSKPSPANAMAIDKIHALVLTQEDFLQLLQENPAFSMKIIKLFADRIRQFDVFLEDLLSMNLHERTWQTLQHLSQYFPESEINLSQEQLADLLWGTRSRVTEVLNRLETEGKIITTRKKIKVL